MRTLMTRASRRLPAVLAVLLTTGVLPLAATA